MSNSPYKRERGRIVLPSPERAGWEPHYLASEYPYRRVFEIFRCCFMRSTIVYVDTQNIQ